MTNDVKDKYTVYCGKCHGFKREEE